MAPGHGGHDHGHGHGHDHGPTLNQPGPWPTPTKRQPTNSMKLGPKRPLFRSEEDLLYELATNTRFSHRYGRLSFWKRRIADLKPIWSIPVVHMPDLLILYEIHSTPCPLQKRIFCRWFAGFENTKHPYRWFAGFEKRSKHKKNISVVRQVRKTLKTQKENISVVRRVRKTLKTQKNQIGGSPGSKTQKKLHRWLDPRNQPDQTC